MAFTTTIVTGDFRLDCPSTKIKKKESALTVIEDEEDKEDFEF